MAANPSTSCRFSSSAPASPGAVQVAVAVADSASGRQSIAIVTSTLPPGLGFQANLTGLLRLKVSLGPPGTGEGATSTGAGKASC
jgi:hypothetical protein